jgi:hypothetical protein
MMMIIIIILVLLVLVLMFTNYNLLKKNEKCEDIIKSYETYMVNFSNIINFSDKKIKEIDARGAFESDDEIGFFFKQIKFLQDQLNGFKIKE